MNRNAKEELNFPYIRDISFTESNAPSYFPPHWHNAAEFSVILKNGCRYRIGDTVYDLNEGDLLFVWPRELHEVMNLPSKGSVFVQFSSSILENNRDLVSASRFLSSFHVIYAKKEPLLAHELKDIIYELKDIYDKNPYFPETKCKLCIYRILLLIGEYVMQEKKDSLSSSSYSEASWEYVRSACSYIADHSTEDISQSHVSKVIGLSPYYFSKLFKEYTQMSFPEYISRIRVQNAVTLLSDNKLSVTDCAFMSGFQSTTTFNKVFRDLIGCTPREFRKLHR